MRVAFVAAALWLALVAPAAADVFDDNPATASRGPGDAWVFARASNGEILERHRANGSWTDWASIGGNATSGPAAVGYGNSVLVFVRGTDAAIHGTTYADGKWTGWSSIGGYTTSAPAATVRRGPPGYVDVSVRGGDNAIFLNTYVPGSGWAGWNSRGGNLTSAPAMNSQADGILNIWSRGVDGAVKQQSWDGAAWSEWSDLGGVTYGAPGAVSRAENLVNVYARGTANALVLRSWVGGVGWGAWTVVDPAAIDSSPAAAGESGSYEWDFARKGDRMVRKDWTSANGWTGWIDFGPVAVPPPPPAPAPPAPDGEVSLEAGVRCTPPGGACG